MKRSDSSEMDRLLRRYAGRGSEALPAMRGAQTSASAQSDTGSHLDADEMNAYAEGALPEATRSHYFAHLADCDSCRKLVTELTLAASLADEEKARVASLEPTPSKSWRERLAVIFSPPVLRFGVPALALFAVIIVAIVAMRTNRKESGVALNTEQTRYSAPAAAPDSNHAAEINTTTGTASGHSNSNVAPFYDEQNQPPRAEATPAPPNPEQQRNDGAPVLSQNTISKSETAPADDTKDAPGEVAVAASREQPEVAASAPAPPPPAPKTAGISVADESEVERRDKRAEQKKSKVAGKEDRDEMVISGGRTSGGTVATQRAANEARPEAGSTSTAARGAQSQSRKRAIAAARNSPAASDMVAEKESSAETRSVGGRRFRRQGSAWVDTAYNSSRPTTNVARGSEQYRALVADEPTLRTIAEQLGGEVFVVWKSRAYRFY